MTLIIAQSRFNKRPWSFSQVLKEIDILDPISPPLSALLLIVVLLPFQKSFPPLSQNARVIFPL